MSVRLAKKNRLAASAAASAGWLALLAATSLGVADLRRFSARVSAGRGVQVQEAGAKLVVQAYDAESVEENGMPRAGAKPVAATVRRLLPGELARGVKVDLVELGATAKTSDSTFIAWIDRSAARGDLDGFAAVPPRQGVLAGSRSNGTTVALELAVRA